MVSFQEYQFPPEAIGGMTGGGVFLVLVSMGILVMYKRKSNQAEREYKRIQIQMDTLESNVRSECKQGKIIILNHFNFMYFMIKDF